MKRRGLFGAAPTFDTPLQPNQEAAYQAWAQAHGRTNDTQDYDLRGAWLSNANEAANGHLPDTWKKPNHPTFSAESQYSTPEHSGGQWVSDGQGGWAFWASPYNVQNLGVRGLSDYFNTREPGSTLLFPFNYRLPPR